MNDYRPDITGLRAIAILTVLVFHIFPNSLPGGYLGVDMFFVISGYIITCTLLKEYNKNNKISLIAFYKRRIFRIAPAIAITIFITIILSNVFMGSDDSVKVAKSATFATLGFANFYFFKYLDTSYFAQDSALVPLLHLWSLGLEEQFYLVFPVLLVILIKFKRLLTFFLIFLAIFSLTYASLIVKNSPTFAYYMLPTRAFALLIGSLAALYCQSAFSKNNKLSNRKIGNILSFFSSL
ncbi:putative acyltransferase family protein [Candidatus Hepatincolaceae symbiont of Richtersius coronifer]